MCDLDATLCHHLDQVSVRQPIGDVPPHAQLDDVGIEYTFAVHRVTRDRLRHSEPPAKDPAVYPMPLDAPEPYILANAVESRISMICGQRTAAMAGIAEGFPQVIALHVRKSVDRSSPRSDSLSDFDAPEEIRVSSTRTGLSVASSPGLRPRSCRNTASRRPGGRHP